MFIHNHTELSYLYYHECSQFAKNNLFYIIWLGYEDCTQGYYLDREGFDNYLFLYTVEGEGLLTYESKNYRLTPDTCMLIDCNKYHCYRNEQKSNWKFHFVHFNGITAPAICSRLKDLVGIKFDGDDSMLSSLREMQLLSKKPSQFFEIFLSEAVTELLSSVFRHNLSESSKKTELINRVIFHIRDNYTSEFTVDDIAKSFFISKSYLQHLFAKRTSVSIYEYITNLRMEKSKKLLTSSDLSINEIAERSGFKSANNYIRLFKKKTGTTPQQFRASFFKADL